MTSEPLTRLVGQLRRTLDASDLTTRSDSELIARFTASRNPAAFETIVIRHGPRVLAACRQVLADESDVEDAFQATFVVFMRRAGAIQNGGALGHWLFGVAHRVALQARAARRRRERIERRAAGMAESPADLSWREACAILHEELGRLPESCRGPLMLCYLEGLSRDEAAAYLGRTRGSVKKGLERGRELLRKRLTRRGVTLSAGLLSAIADSSKAGMSPGLVRATIRCAEQPAPAVATLARAVAAKSLPMKAGWTVLAASVLAVGIAFGVPREDKPKSQPAEKETKAEVKPVSYWTYAGAVTGPDGKPVKGAKLWLCLHGSPKLRALGESGPDGKFSIRFDRSEWTTQCYYENGRDLWSPGTILAFAPGLPVGYGHCSIIEEEKTAVRVPLDDVAIDGKVQNLEGQPVAGATIRVIGLYEPKGADLGAWYDDVKDGKLGQQLIYDHLIAFESDELIDGVLNPLYRPVTTGKDGSFKLRGIGRERVALVRIESDGIETTDVMLMTRDGTAVLPTPVRRQENGLPRSTQGRYAVYGSTAKITVAPSRPIVGMIRDMDTGKPLVGAVVQLTSAGGVEFRTPERIRTRTDAEGRYKLTGAPVRRDCEISVEGPADQPYLAAAVEVPKTPGLEAVTVDLKLKRGIWATVRVFDKTDNSPVAGDLHYFIAGDNPHLKDVPNLLVKRVRKVRVTDETFRIPVLPGKGILAVEIHSSHPFVTTSSPRARPVDARPYGFRPQDYLGHARIDPAVDDKEVKCEIGLTRGTD
jgi:RNA polymerase sigma factor (sigma-70 family)